MSGLSEEIRSGFEGTDRLAVLVRGVRDNDAECGNELARTLERGLRLMMYRHLGNKEDVDDGLQYCLLTIISAVRMGKLQQPSAVAGYARTVAQRYIAHTIHDRERVRERHVAAETVEIAIQPDQECDCKHKEQTAILLAALAKLCELDREILRRFYLLEHSEERIRKELSLTETQFRLRKSRAKKRLAAEAESLMRPNLTSRLRKGVRKISELLASSAA